VSRSGNLLAVVTGSNFSPRSLHLIDINSKTVKQTISIVSCFVGVDFTPTGDRIFVGGGSDNDVKIFKLAADGWASSTRPRRRFCRKYLWAPTLTQRFCTRRAHRKRLGTSEIQRRPRRSWRDSDRGVPEPPGQTHSGHIIGRPHARKCMQGRDNPLMLGVPETAETYYRKCFILRTLE
jgi:WD40 repeat protein